MLVPGQQGTRPFWDKDTYMAVGKFDNVSTRYGGSICQSSTQQEGRWVEGAHHGVFWQSATRSSRRWRWACPHGCMVMEDGAVVLYHSSQSAMKLFAMQDDAGLHRSSWRAGGREAMANGIHMVQQVKSRRNVAAM